jgi:hypothetical protein
MNLLSHSNAKRGARFGFLSNGQGGLRA